MLQKRTEQQSAIFDLAVPAAPGRTGIQPWTSRVFSLGGCPSATLNDSRSNRELQHNQSAHPESEWARAIPKLAH